MKKLEFEEKDALNFELYNIKKILPHLTSLLATLKNYESEPELQYELYDIIQRLTAFCRRFSNELEGVELNV